MGAAVLAGPRLRSQAAGLAQDAGEPQAGGTLRIAQIGDPRFLNPLRQLPYWAWGGIYDSLLRYDGSGGYVPHLAEVYEVSPDGASVTMTLRSNVTFHSGRPFTSEDVAFALEQLQNPETSSPFRTFALAVTEIELPDAQTAVFRLAQPEAGILDLLGNFYVPDREAYAEIDRRGAGTGPFEFVEFVPGDHIALKRYEEYWGQPAYLDGIEIPIFGDPQAAVTNLEAGAIDVTDVPLVDFLRLEGDDAYETRKLLGAGMYNLWLNTQRPPLDNQMVRQAIAFAINRERFNETILRGQSQATNNPLPPDHWAFFPDLDDVYPFDLERAGSLLAEAGHAEGFAATANVNSQDREALGLAQILQADLAEIGVELMLDAKDGPRWAEASRLSEFDINVHSYQRATADPSLLFQGTTTWRPDGNPTGFDEPRYRELINAQSAAIDRAERLPLLRDLVAYVQEQAFVIPIAPSVTPFATRSTVEGWTMLPIGPVAYMEQVWLAE
jgi:peptide/nickel transport system substrate-binding protein